MLSITTFLAIFALMLGCKADYSVNDTNKDSSRPNPNDDNTNMNDQDEDRGDDNVPEIADPSKKIVDPLKADIEKKEPTFFLPVPVVSSVHAKSAIVTWASASDDPALKIKYRLCVIQSGTSVATISEVSTTCESAGWQSDWQDSLSLTATGLSVDTEYRAVVVAENQSNKKLIFSSATFSTTDNLAPAVSGVLTISDLTPVSAKLSWTAASDDLIAVERLEYRVCLSREGNIDTIAKMNANCQWQSRWSRHLREIIIYGLVPNKTYYLNVVVRDVVENAAIYPMKAVTAAAPVTNTYFVDDAFTIATDNGTIGLTPGDVVVFSDTEFAQTGGLVYGTNAFDTFDAAVTAANTSGTEATIVVGTGTFTLASMKTFTVNAHIIGTDNADTVLMHSFNGNTSNLILFGPSTGGTVANLTIDGANNFLQRAVYNSQGETVVVANSTIRNILKGTGSYDGRGVQSYGPTARAIVLNNNFANIGRLGVNFHQANVGNVFQWNIYEAKGEGDHLDYAMQNYLTSGTIFKENLVKNNRGIASVDGSQGAAIGAFASTTNSASIVISYNEIVDSDYGFHFGISANELGEYQMVGNVLTNVDKGVATTALVTPVVAENNWWGDATGPKHTTHNPNGTGADLGGSLSITFQPWALSPKID